jgi:hypothetical protein
MLEIITITILLNNGQNYFYYLLLMEKLKSKIDKLFNLRLKFKLLNNSILIKSKLNIRKMFDFNNYWLRLMTERNFRKNVKKDIKNTLIKEIEEEIKEKNELKESEIDDKKYKELHWVKCENKKCNHHTCPEHLLNDLHVVLTAKLNDPKKSIPTEQKKVLGLILKCEDKDKEILFECGSDFKKIDIQCRECKHDLSHVKFTPTYILQLQSKKSKVKLNH